ncbi:PLP-dependent aminotransferase family protein [Lacticaseibacillus baoqingensis]|uniref:PLP-dependent aminotransferase family protein n=1 Tax=Lacticaseibacillus baoqingensis TaxID=2486013 RepID=A0ABW4EC71_9LACO|nr:PLP-dependent aminotransferase family protein [Lacticaseibacillus baoqingensis]
MNWQLPQTHHPAYLRVIALITTAIDAGELLPGSRLPAERWLAQTLGVNRSTIQRALGELVSQGLLTRKVGSGTWVNADKWGVAQPTRWHDYLSTNRLSGPDPFSLRLAALRQTPGMIDLADSTIAAELAVPLTPTGLSVAALYAQERQMDITGDAELKRAVVARLQPLLGAVTPEQVLITSGAQQAYYLLSQGLLSDGDAIAVEAPSYFYQLTLFQAAGIRIYGVPLHAGELDLAALTQVYHQHHVRFLFVNPTGQNPTGATMTLAQRQKLLAHCRSLHLPIVEDDLLGITNALRPAAVPPLHRLDPDNVLYIGSLSPLLGPHTRIGWLIAPPGVVQRLAQIRQQMEAEISVFPQAIAAQLLAQPDLAAAVVKQQQRLDERQAVLAAALAPLVQARLVDYALPAANNHFWVTLNTAKPLGAADYSPFLHAGVLVRPDFLFGSHHNQVRMSYARLKPDQKAALQARLAQAVYAIVAHA